jgi:CRP-like cAMP-binding protein
MANKLSRAVSNRILRSLRQADFAALEPHLMRVDLPKGTPLEVRNRRIERAYFPDGGFASVCANCSGGPMEVAMVGREGMTGTAIIMGADRSPLDIVMQGAGTGWQIAGAKLRRLIQQSPDLHGSLLLFAHALSVQAGLTVAASGGTTLEERLAKWLLMVQDRSDGDTVAVTPQIAASALGVRRAGVSVAMKAFADAGIIKISRRAVAILNRKALLRRSKGSYGVAEAEYDRLLGPRSPSTV